MRKTRLRSASSRWWSGSSSLWQALHASARRLTELANLGGVGGEGDPPLPVHHPDHLDPGLPPDVLHHQIGVGAAVLEHRAVERVADRVAEEVRLGDHLREQVALHRELGEEEGGDRRERDDRRRGRGASSRAGGARDREAEIAERARRDRARQPRETRVGGPSGDGPSGDGCGGAPSVPCSGLDAALGIAPPVRPARTRRTQTWAWTWTWTWSWSWTDSLGVRFDLSRPIRVLVPCSDVTPPPRRGRVLSRINGCNDSRRLSGSARRRARPIAPRGNVDRPRDPAYPPRLA